MSDFTIRRAEKGKREVEEKEEFHLNNVCVSDRASPSAPLSPRGKILYDLPQHDDTHWSRRSPPSKGGGGGGSGGSGGEESSPTHISRRVSIYASRFQLYSFIYFILFFVMI